MITLFINTICLFHFLGMFDIEIVKNRGIVLAFQQFYALLLKRIFNSMRNYLVLFAAVLPILFVVISLIIEQQIPKPEDSPPLLMSLERYKKTNVPFTYDRNDASSMNFINSYEYTLNHSSWSPALIDLTTNHTRPCQEGKPTDIISYLACIGQRSLLELSDLYLIGAEVNSDKVKNVLNITALFNNQPYHVPPLTLNFLTNTLLKQYSSITRTNTTIHVVNHPVNINSKSKINPSRDIISLISLSACKNSDYIYQTHFIADKIFLFVFSFHVR